MGWADFVLKYRGSILGYLWSFLGPLVYFIVLLYVFSPFVSGIIASYPLYLFIGIIIFEHFQLTTSTCVGMLRDKSSVLQKVSVPKLLLILSVGWTHVIIFLTRFFIFLLFALVLGGAPLMHYLYLPIILLQMTLLSLGFGMMLCAYALKYRDIEHLWGIVLQALFWLCPIAYPSIARGTIFQDFRTMTQTVSLSHPKTIVDLFIRFQPISLIMDEARRLFLPPGSLAMPSIWHLLGVCIVCGIVFWIGARVFIRRSPYFLEEY